MSHDPDVARLARDDLVSVTSKRLHRLASLEDAEIFLSGETEGELRIPPTQLRRLD